MSWSCAAFHGAMQEKPTQKQLISTWNNCLSHSCLPSLTPSHPLILPFFPPPFSPHKKREQSERTHGCGNFHDHTYKKCTHVNLLDFKQMLCTKRLCFVIHDAVETFMAGHSDKNLTRERLKKHVHVVLMSLTMICSHHLRITPKLPWCLTFLNHDFPIFDIATRGKPLCTKKRMWSF